MAELEQVVHLLLSLYSPTTPPSSLPSIQSHLHQFQQSPLAWSLVPQLLSHENGAVRFFAANTLQGKISNNWSDLSSLDDQRALKESALGWLNTSCKLSYPANGTADSGERIVTRKLVSALVSFSLRTWEDESVWGEGWFVELLSRTSLGVSRDGGMEVLRVVVEQVGRAEVVGNKRQNYLSTLTSSTPHLLSSIQTSLSPTSQSSLSLVLTSLKSFSSLLSLLPLSSTSPELIEIYELILPFLYNEETLVDAAAVIGELIEGGGPGGVAKFMSRMKVERLIVEWSASAFVGQLVREAASSPPDDDEDDDELEDLSPLHHSTFTLLSSLSESIISYLFSPPSSSSPSPPLSLLSPQIHTLFSHLLSLSSSKKIPYQTREIPTMSWMLLQEESGDVGLVGGEGEGREGRRGREGEWEALRGIFGGLLEGAREGARWKDGRRKWDKDRKDSFRTYRNTTLQETFTYCYYVLRERMVDDLVRLALQQVANSGLDEGFENLEATIFAISCISESITPSSSPSSESSSLSHLFSSSLLSAVPLTPLTVSLRSTLLSLIHSYSSWFSASTTTEALLAAVQFVVSNLMSEGDEGLVSSAARTLRGLCDENRSRLRGFVVEFGGLLGSLEGRVEDEEFTKVLESVSSVVQALEGGEIVGPLLAISEPIVAKLGNAVMSYQSSPDASRTTCLQQLSYLTSISSGLSNPNSDMLDLDASLDEDDEDGGAARRAELVLGEPRVAEMRKRLSGAVEGVVVVWSADAEIVQALADFIKSSTADTIPSPLALDPLNLFRVASKALQKSISSVWLLIECQLLARIARTPGGEEGTREATERTISAGLGYLRDTRAMEENPDLVMAFLNFCTVVVKFYPTIFIALAGHLDAIYTFGERGLGMQERFSLKSTIDLLIACVQQTRMASSSSVIFHQTLLPHVHPMLHTLLLSISGAVPRSHLTALSELLHAFVLRIPNETRTVLHELLQIPNWPNENATSAAKAKFERAMLTARSGKQARVAVSEFAVICRGLSDTAYGAASSDIF